MDAPSFMRRLTNVFHTKNGAAAVKIFDVSVFFSHDDILIWMFLPLISNRIELKATIKMLNDNELVSFSEEDNSFYVCDEARLLQRDELNRMGVEDMALKNALLFLKSVKPSYYIHYISVYLHSKQYPDLFHHVGDLPGNMLRGMINDNKDCVAVRHGKEWIEFLTEILGERHWTVLHLRSRFGLALLEMGNRDGAVLTLVDVYNKTCNAFGRTEIRDVMVIMADIFLRVNPKEKSNAEEHLRKVVFGGKNILDCEDNSELEKWIYYADLLGRFGLASVGVSVLQDVMKYRRRLYGPRDDGIYDVMQAKAQILRSDSKYAEALKVLQIVYRRRRKQFGNSNPKTLEVMNTKGSILILQGKLKEALTVFDQVIAHSAVSVREGHESFLTAKTEMVKIHMLQKNFDEALRIGAGVQDKLSTHYGVVHPQCFNFRKHMGVILWEKGDLQKSHRVLKDLLDDFENSYDHETEMSFLKFKIEGIESTLFAAKPFTMHFKVKMGYLNELTKKVSSWNVGFTDEHSQTALHYAAAFDRVEEARVLLRNGAKYDYPSKNFFTPLDLAKKGGEMHALLTTVHSFFEAVKRNDCDAVIEPASKEPCVFLATNSENATPLQLAIMCGHLAMVKALLQLGADPKATGHLVFRMTPMLTAAAYGNVAIAEALLNHIGPEALGLQQGFFDHRSPLIVAAARGHLSMTRFLLSRGSVFCLRNEKGQMARQVAVDPSVKDLLRFTEELFHDTRRGQLDRVMARMRAVKEDEKEALAGAKNDQHRTLVQVAMGRGNVELVKEIVQGLKLRSPST